MEILALLHKQSLFFQLIICFSRHKTYRNPNEVNLKDILPLFSI